MPSPPAYTKIGANTAHKQNSEQKKKTLFQIMEYITENSNLEFYYSHFFYRNNYIYFTIFSSIKDVITEVTFINKSQ